jgi:hypothetical protein
MSSSPSRVHKIYIHSHVHADERSEWKTPGVPCAPCLVVFVPPPSIPAAGTDTEFDEISKAASRRPGCCRTRKKSGKTFIAQFRPVPWHAYIHTWLALRVSSLSQASRKCGRCKKINLPILSPQSGSLSESLRVIVSIRLNSVLKLSICHHK